jgi:hypothetical protein
LASGHLHRHTHTLLSRPDHAIASHHPLVRSVSLSSGARLSAESAPSPFRDKAIYPQLLLSLPRLRSSPRLPPDLAAVPRRGNARLPSRLAKPCSLPGLICCVASTSLILMRPAPAARRAVACVSHPLLLPSASCSLSSAASQLAIACAERVCGYACPARGCPRRPCWFRRTSACSASRSDGL